ncbi:MAG: DUF1992 domain-containing protein [Pseudomonadota bacterium]
MSRSLSRLVEQQIVKAIAEGQLDGLDGEGKPLPDRSGEATGDAVTAIAMRIMADAGAVPEEFKWKKALDAARENYQTTQSEEEKRAAMALIAELELRYNIAVEARRAFLKP